MEEFAAQARSTLFTLYNVQSKLGTFSINKAFKLFDTILLPIVTDYLHDVLKPQKSWAMTLQFKLKKYTTAFVCMF